MSLNYHLTSNCQSRTIIVTSSTSKTPLIDITILYLLNFKFDLGLIIGPN